MKKILVTGAAGFMGSWISHKLVEKGYFVYGIDDLSGGSIENIKDLKNGKNNFEFHNLDLSDTGNDFGIGNTVKETIERIKPQIVYHLAANAREGASFFQPLEIVKRNLLGYTNVLEGAIKGGELDKVILFSSMAVYGNGIAPFNEEDKREPVDIYGINKASMEHMTEILSNVHNFRYTILRPHNVFGEHQCLCDVYRNVIGIWMNKIMKGEDIYIYGDGRQKRAFSYIGDSIDCYIRAMDSECDSEIINIGGSVPITINTLSEIVTRYMDVQGYPIKYLSDRYGEIKDAWCTVDKSRRLLGYKEDIGFDKGIERMAKWAKKRGNQEWKCEKLSLWNEKAPEWWK